MPEWLLWLMVAALALASAFMLGDAERDQPRIGTIECECGWSRRQRWWRRGFTLRQVATIDRLHRMDAHPDTFG